ncbi:MAG TPA: lytic transglycosylase [Chitinophagaceae bacterium]|nr:lytic transglycosylase [Chitinophagaceae bacterium]
MKGVLTTKITTWVSATSRIFSGVVLLVLLFVSLVSFKHPKKNVKKSQTMIAVTDTTDAADKQFPSLFNASNYDPSKPYMAQLNPKAVPFVQAYIEKNRRMLEQMKEWGKPYFDLYDRVLRDNDLPVELKYLSVIESHLRSGLTSYAGAVGPWQMMPEEARRWGLKVNSKVDERKDFVKSTAAAAQLLKALYADFGDWLLVIAAYNAGPNRVKSAIKKSGSTDFWVLQAYLPNETRNHVKKFIGTHYLMEGGAGWTTMTAAETNMHKANVAGILQQPMLTNAALAQTAVVAVKGRFKASVIAKTLGMSLSEFQQYNPGFEQLLAQGKPYQLRLPEGKMSLFQQKRSDILQESVQVMLAAQPNIATSANKM